MIQNLSMYWNDGLEATREIKLGRGSILDF